MNETAIISFLGKGGVGKTILSAITGKIFIESGKKVLFIDADPAMGLATSLQVEGQKTIGEAREDIIRQAKHIKSDTDREHFSDTIDYLLFETLYEGADSSLIIMGQTDTLGCYCPLNTLLRSAISSIASNYDIIIIDAEAGIEQINRQVVESVQYPLIITDNSMRGVKTSILVKETIEKVPKMSPVKVGVIFNRVEESDPLHIEKINSSGLIYYGSIKPDPVISDFDRRGLSIIGMPDNAVSVKEMKKIISEIGLSD